MSGPTSSTTANSNSLTTNNVNKTPARPALSFRTRGSIKSVEEEPELPPELKAALDLEDLDENPFLEDDDGVTVIIKRPVNPDGTTEKPIFVSPPPRTSLMSPAAQLSSGVSQFAFGANGQADPIIPGPSTHITPFKVPKSKEEIQRRQSAHDRQIRAQRSLNKRRPSRRGSDSD